MPTYEFENENGEPEELFLWMSEAPPLGGTLEHEGRKLTRVIHAPPEYNVQKPLHFEGRTMPAKMTPEERAATGHRHWTKNGMPFFTSRRQVSKYLAKEGGTYGSEWSAIKP